MDQTISVLSNENITQLRRLKEVLEEHSYKPETLKDIDTSISWLPSTLYKLKEGYAPKYLNSAILYWQNGERIRD